MNDSDELDRDEDGYLTKKGVQQAIEIMSQKGPFEGCAPSAGFWVPVDKPSWNWLGNDYRVAKERSRIWPPSSC